jgi:hypothetical protein
MDRDNSFLIEFLKNKIRKLECGELSTSEFILLRDYFLTTIIPEVSDDELKRYLFVGYYLLNS